jgi:hypothetical protein
VNRTLLFSRGCHHGMLEITPVLKKKIIELLHELIAVLMQTLTEDFR